jgi:cell division protein ZapD
VNNTITYEFPLNERIRVFIRLEQLFKQFFLLSLGESVAEKRAAITVILDLMTLFKRNDLKSELLKELDRQASNLNKIANIKGVDRDRLQEILAQLTKINEKLYAITGKIGGHILESHLFQSIAQRSSIPGGTYSFDLPEYHYWLEQNESVRAKDMQYWSNSFNDIYVAIEFILDFIRNSRSPSEEMAIAGFFQLALDTNQAFQLIKISIDASLPYFAEISGGKHRCTIRFMEPSINGKRPTQTINDIPFQLTCCLF